MIPNVHAAQGWPPSSRDSITRMNSDARRGETRSAPLFDVQDNHRPRLCRPVLNLASLLGAPPR
jgi:hypothetical protein